MTLDNAMPALAVILNEDRLSEAFGESLRADSLRYKPGVSAVARLHDGSGRARWVAAYAPGHTAKLDKLRRRAAMDGAALCSVVAPPSPVLAPTSSAASPSPPLAEGGQVLTSGPVELDYKLWRPLRKLRAEGFLLPTTVLNYNPSRRLVLSLQHGREPVVTKITVGSASVPPSLLESLAAAGVPVLCQVNPGLPESRHVSYYPWYGQGNLKDGLRDGSSGVGSVRAAGAALAALHAQPLPTSASCRVRAMAAAEAESKLADTAGNLTELVPHLASWLHSAATRIRSALPNGDQPVLLHGDFSSDQILTGPESLRIIDLDRWGSGPAVADLGGFVAEEIAHPSGLPQTDIIAALLDGYTGRVNEPALAAWTAFHLYCRLSEPFRSCSPDWRNQIAQRLECIDGLVP